MISGRVLLDGKPVHYYGVIVSRNFAMSWQQPPIAIHIHDGRFAIADVQPGVWDVVIAGPGFARYVAPGKTLEQAQALDLGDITVRRGHTIQGRVRYLVEGVAEIDLSGRHARVSATLPGGLVSLTHDVPNSDATIDLVLTAGGEIDGVVTGAFDAHSLVFVVATAKPRAMYTTVLASDGTFTVPQIPVGEYDVFVVSGSSARSGPPSRVTVSADQPANISLTSP